MEGQHAGQEMQNGIGMKLCWCPPGTFVMGSPMDELGRNPRNEDQVKVALTRGFWLGKYPVTQAEYEAVTGSNPSHFEGGKDLPVEQVGWHDAVAFCRKVTKRECASGKMSRGWAYGLPREAEWEYACRAGTTSALNSGKELTSERGACLNLEEVGWYDANSGGRTHAVGGKAANRWGLHDMHGNVAEWCADLYEDRLRGGRDPEGASPGSNRVIRGGRWYELAGECRAAARVRLVESARSNYLGFRVVLSPAR